MASSSLSPPLALDKQPIIAQNPAQRDDSAISRALAQCCIRRQWQWASGGTDMTNGGTAWYQATEGLDG